jgi:hypothetical protein
MCTLFHCDAAGELVALRLEQARYSLSIVAGSLVLAVAALGHAPASGALLLRTRPALDEAGPTWSLHCGEGVELYVNGALWRIGLRVLRHRDEIRLGGGPSFYFSSERVARVEPYDRDDTPKCPRCAQAIRRGDLSVACPGCGVRLHQTEELPCWTHVPKCAACEQATALDAGLQWKPEDP